MEPGCGEVDGTAVEGEPVGLLGRPACPVCPVCDSATPTGPEPETAWYVVATRAMGPASRWRGRSTGTAAIVVRFGLAMTPFGRFAIAPGWTSETTGGTSGSRPQAEESPITTAPAAATFGAGAREVTPPAERITTSKPR